MRSLIHAHPTNSGRLVRTLAVLAVVVWASTLQAGIFQDRFQVPEPADTRVVTGVAVKGPFVEGGTVMVRGLGLDLSDTEQSFTDTIRDNFGRFTVSATAGLQVLDIQVRGNFFNELTLEDTSAPPEAQLTLSALTQQPHNAQVTVLTSLERPRVEALVAQGVPFRMAKRQAVDEWYALFDARPDRRDAANISVTSPDAPVLLALTALLMTRSDGEARQAEALSDWIDLYATAFAESAGSLPSALMADLLSVSSLVDPLAFRAALEVALVEGQGASASTPDFAGALSAFQQRNGHRIVLSVEGDGRLNGPSERWVPKGQATTISTTPARGHSLVAGAGSCAGGQAADNNPGAWQTGVINADCELTLQFAPNQYALALDLNGGTLDQRTVNVTFGKPIGDLPTPTRAGHTFLGWQPLGSDELWQADRVYDRTRTTTLSAQWAVNTVTLSFDVNQGGPAVDNITQPFGSAITPPADPVREGWEFAGWAPDFPASMPAEDQQFTAQWTPGLTVLSGRALKGPHRRGAEVLVRPVDEASFAPTDQHPVFDNPLFEGEVINNLGDFEVPVPTLMAAYQIEVIGPFFHELLNRNTSSDLLLDGLTARREALNVNVLSTIERDRVRAKAKGGMSLEEAKAETIATLLALFGVSSTDISDATALVLDDSPEAAALLAWTAVLLTEPDGSPRSGSALGAFIKALREDFDNSDGQFSDATRSTLLKAALAADVPTFVANLQSYLDQESDAPVVLPSATAVSNAVTAFRDQVGVRVEFVLPSEISVEGATTFWQLQGTSLERAVTVASGFEVQLPDPAPAGDCPGLELNNSMVTSAPLTENCTVTLNTNNLEYQLHFDVRFDLPEDETAPGSCDVISNQVIPDVCFPDDPSREGHVFGGWNTQRSGGGETWAPGQVFNRNTDVTLYAQWTPMTFCLLLIDPGAPAPAAAELTFGQQLPTRAAPERDGFRFLGYRLITEIIEDEPPELGDYYYDASMNPLRVWDLTVNPIDDKTPPEECPDLTVAPEAGAPLPFYLVAEQEPKRFVVTLDQAGGAGGTERVEVLMGGRLPDITVPTRDGYDFQGYSLSEQADGEFPIYRYDSAGKHRFGPDWEQPEDTTLYAWWTVLEFRLTFQGESGVVPLVDVNGDPLKLCSEPSSQQSIELCFAFDEDVQVPADPVRDNYVFVGWHPAPPDVMPLEDREISAQWQPAQQTISINFDCPDVDDLPVTVTFNEMMPDLNIPGLGLNALPECPGLLFGNIVDGDGVPHYVNINGQLQAFTSWNGEEGDTLHATWSTDIFPVTLDPDGGELPSGQSVFNVFFQDTLPTFPVPTRLGHDFQGWFTEQDGQGEEVDGGDSPFTEATTLFAHWQPTIYTLTLDPQGGAFENASVNDPITTVVAFGSSLLDAVAAIEAPIPVREGHEFNGWSLTEAGEVIDAGTLHQEADDVTLFARWTPREFEVSLDLNGGAGAGFPASVTATFNRLMPAINEAIPTKADHVFTGFFRTSEEGGAMFYDAGMQPISAWDSAAAGTIYAGWGRNVFTLTFDSDGGSPVESITLKVGDPVPAPDDPTKTGHTFDRWEPSLPAQMPEPNQTHTAQWTVNDYKLIFNSAGGSAVASIKQDFDTPINAPADPTRTGYTFEGWSPPLPGTMPAANQTHTAQWAPETYTVTLDAQSGQWPNASSAHIEITATFDQAMPFAPTPAREGHTLIGFFAEINGAGTGYYDGDMSSASDWDIDGNATLHADWDINKYTLTFDSAGGSEVAPITEDFATAVPVPDQPVLAGYEFNGWSPSLPDTMPASNATLVAQWEAKTYQLVLDRQGGSGGSSGATGTFDNPWPTGLRAPVRTGFTFGGYFDQEAGEGTQHYDADMAVVLSPNTWTSPADVTLFAHWLPRDFTLGFDSNGGSEVDAITQPVGSTIDAPEPPTRTGHTFHRWSPPLPETMPASNDTLVAQWTPNEYTLTFLKDSGQGGDDDVTVVFGQPLPNIVPPTREGFEFEGYLEIQTLDRYFDSAGQGMRVFQETTDLELLAQWDPVSAWIFFDSTGGSPVEPMPVNNSQLLSLVPLPTPTRSGYGFDGWVVAGGAALPELMPPNDLNLTAQWTANDYTLTFDSAGGTAVAAITQPVDTAVTAPAAPTRTGHVFQAWQPSLPATMPPEDLTLTAQWEVKTFTLTFEDDDGNVLATRTQDFGTTVRPPTLPQRDGFSAAWQPTPPATMPAEDATFTVQYTSTRVVLEPRVTPAEGGVLTLLPAEFNVGGSTGAVVAANQGYEFIEVLACGEVVATSGSEFELGPFTTDCVVEARFALRNFCREGLCLNGGTCINLPFEETYHCECVEGLVGDNCEFIDACALYASRGINPCGSSGTCVSSDSGIRCNCSGSAACSCCTGINLLPCSSQGLGGTGDFCITPNRVAEDFPAPDEEEPTTLRDAIERWLWAHQGDGSTEDATTRWRPLASPINEALNL